MKLNRIMLAAVKSGSGKTTIVCALLRALQERGIRTVSYKCGPDYIDPMFHRQVLGVPSRNLDTFFTDEVRTRELFLKDRASDELAVLEGVMGLFDGLGGIKEEGSSYHLAKVTKTPIVLVIDAKGMGRSIIPLISGFLSYDKAGLVKGVILNKISPSYYAVLKPLIEEELKIKVLGYMAEQKQLRLESRHLGLIMPGELSDIQKILQLYAEELEKTVDVEGIIQLAEKAGEIGGSCLLEKTDCIAEAQKNRPVIAVARDEAFCFYYEDNLRLLKEKGAEIRFFSPIHDDGLPEGCAALLLGGGYPELYADKLGRNVHMRMAVKKAFLDKMPIVAECGGFMYLHTAIEDESGCYPMAGVLSGVCQKRERLVRFGYVEIEEKCSSFLPAGQRIKGHEFHYFDSEDNGSGCIAKKPVTGRSYDCIVGGENCWLGFPHLYYPSNPAFAENLVKKAKKYSEMEG